MPVPVTLNAPWKPPPNKGGVADIGQFSWASDTKVVQTAIGLALSGPGELHFTYLNLPASTSSTKLYRILADGSSVVGSQLSVPMPSRGNVAALTLASSAAITAGAATFAIWIEGAVTTAELEWTTGTTKVVGFTANQYTFKAGDSLDVRVTTSNFAPTTADIEVTAYVIFTAET